MDILDLRFDKESSTVNVGDDSFIFYAHENEKFSDHVHKTLEVFKELVDENILLNFYKKFKKSNSISLSFTEFLNLIYNHIEFHDMGKLSFNFQINRLNKKNMSVKQNQIEFLEKHNWESLVNELEADHSFVGAGLFLYNNKNLEENDWIVLLLSYIILGHHTNLKDILNEDSYFYDNWNSKKVASLSLISCFLDLNNNKISLEKGIFQRFYKKAFKSLQENFDKHNAEISLFYSYIYSLLIVSDIFATQNYKINPEEINYSKFNNRIDNKLFKNMNSSFLNVSYNNNLDFNEKRDFNTNDINDLRRYMLLESSKNLLNILNTNKYARVFFLNMPTGGGKTNTSMKLALDIISNTDANRIIYAMPFINIIEQNFEELCKTFNLEEADGFIRKIYSGSEFFFNSSDEEKIELISFDDFFNFPVICTTFVSFFNNFIKNRKKDKYKISAIANSVVILDEIQSLPLKNWNSLYYLINELAINYNIYFIIMSATLPDFNKLKLDKYQKLSYEKNNLLDSEVFFNHYLFDRTEIKEKLVELDMEDETFIDFYVNKIYDNFNQNYNKGLIVLNTIRSSKKIFELLKEEFEDEDDFKIILLNSGQLSYKKNQIIHNLSNMGEDQKLIVVSTQSIEAGVDVSFDFVIRDFATLDSIEQVRGRCNRSREINKKFNDDSKKGNVYITNLKDKKELYRYIYDDAEINSRILESKAILDENLDYNLNKYYNQVTVNVNNNIDSKEDEFLKTDLDNIKNFNQLKYSLLKDSEHGIHIIDKKYDTYSLFIKTKIPINLSGKNIEKMSSDDLTEYYKLHKEDFIFSDKELLYLRNEYGFVLDNNYVDGEKLLDCYIHKKQKISGYDSNKIKILNKEFSSILNKFIINVSISDDDLKSDVESLEKIGYFHVIDSDKIGDDEEHFYSEEYGFNFNPIICNVL